MSASYHIFHFYFYPLSHLFSVKRYNAILSKRNVKLCAKIEEELSQLEPEEKENMANTTVIPLISRYQEIVEGNKKYSEEEKESEIELKANYNPENELNYQHHCK